MINDFWLKVFIIAYFCIIGLGILIDAAYYSKTF